MMKKIPSSIIIGIIAGLLVSIAWFALSKSLGYYSVNLFIYVYFLKLLFILFGVLVSVYLMKRKNGGFMEFKTALQTGMLYCLALAVVLAIFNAFYYKFIAPDTIDFFLAEAKKYAETTAKLTGEELEKFLDAEKGRFGSFAVIPPILFWGLIMSLIAGLLFRKKDPNAANLN